MASRSQIIHEAAAQEFTNQRERKRGQMASLRNSVTVMKEGSKDYVTQDKVFILAAKSTIRCF